MELYFLLGGLGIITGFLSGLLGIGGGIIMAPLLLYLPQLFGFEILTMQTVAGLTIVQGLVACIAGGLTHLKFQFSSGKLVAWMGVTLFVASFIGGASSKIVANEILLIIFACMALVASFLMILPRDEEIEIPDIKRFSFSRFRAVSVSGSIGVLGGLVGQGGSFILIPLMTSYMKVPTRIAIGSNLAIVFLSTLAAFIGKSVTFQINWALSLPIVLTVIPAAYLGAHASRKLPVGDLRIILAICIAIAAFRIGFSAFGF